VITAATVHSFSLSGEPIDTVRVETYRKPREDEIITKDLAYLHPHSYFEIKIEIDNLTDKILEGETLPDPIMELSKQQINFLGINLGINLGIKTALLTGFNKGDDIVILEKHATIGKIGERHK